MGVITPALKEVSRTAVECFFKGQEVWGLQETAVFLVTFCPFLRDLPTPPSLSVPFLPDFPDFQGWLAGGPGGSPVLEAASAAKSATNFLRTSALSSFTKRPMKLEEV